VRGTACLSDGYSEDEDEDAQDAPRRVIRCACRHRLPVTHQLKGRRYIAICDVCWVWERRARRELGYSEAELLAAAELATWQAGERQPPASLIEVGDAEPTARNLRVSHIAPISAGHKFCVHCEEVKPRTAFRGAHSGDGLRHWCRACETGIPDPDPEPAPAVVAETPVADADRQSEINIIEESEMPTQTVPVPVAVEPLVIEQEAQVAEAEADVEAEAEGPAPGDEWLIQADIARSLGITPYEVQKWRKAGRLQPKKMGEWVGARQTVLLSLREAAALAAADAAAAAAQAAQSAEAAASAPDLVTIREAATLLGRPHTTVHGWYRAGKVVHQGERDGSPLISLTAARAHHEQRLGAWYRSADLEPETHDDSVEEMPAAVAATPMEPPAPEPVAPVEPAPTPATVTLTAIVETLAPVAALPVPQIETLRVRLGDMVVDLDRRRDEALVVEIEQPGQLRLDQFDHLVGAVQSVRALLVPAVGGAA
jgi:hypothetical protein